MHIRGSPGALTGSFSNSDCFARFWDPSLLVQGRFPNVDFRALLRQHPFWTPHLLGVGFVGVFCKEDHNHLQMLDWGFSRIFLAWGHVQMLDFGFLGLSPKPFSATLDKVGWFDLHLQSTGPCIFPVFHETWRSEALLEDEIQMDPWRRDHLKDGLLEREKVCSRLVDAESVWNGWRLRLLLLLLLILLLLLLLLQLFLVLVVTFELPMLTFELPMLTFELPHAPFCRNKHI